MDSEHPDWGYHPSSPFGFPVLSLKDWRTVFTTRPGELRDEYNTLIDDPLAWLDESRPPTDDDRRRAMQWWDAYQWYDPQGHHFSSREFS